MTDLVRQDHILTVSLEDYFHVRAFGHVIQRGQWYRFETRLEHSSRRALELLDELDCRATFFVLGWVAETMPELVRAIADRGHEVADRGFYPRPVRDLTPAEFREDLARSRAAIAAATGRPVRGFRAAHLWRSAEELWALGVVAEEGYAYDSSFAPFGWNRLSTPAVRRIHLRDVGGARLWEVPVSSIQLFGATLPIAGGNYLRQLPEWCSRRAFDQWARESSSPFVMYFNVWELDPEQPRIGGGALARVRHYRNLDRMHGRLRRALSWGRFGTVASYLDLPLAPLQEAAARPEAARTIPRSEAIAPPAPRLPLTIVVPCFNEARVIPYLANTLRSVERELAPRYEPYLLFVDDRSTDGTRSALEREFGSRDNCRIVSHERNEGVAGAIRTGLRLAATEVVCSIDCDCSYDPHALGRMIPLLDDDVALVTASPYHPDGGVRNVPRWRLLLSRSLSQLYRLVLRNKLRTYTSCFRVYRRSRALGIELKHTDFLGVVELLARIDLSGGRVVEFPTVLEARLLGRSKLKVLRTMLGHLRLLARIASLRLLAPPSKTTVIEPAMLPERQDP